MWGVGRVCILDYVSLALSKFALVTNGKFDRKMIFLPHNFWPKNVTFALVKKGTFAQETLQHILKSALNSPKGPPQAQKTKLQTLPKRIKCGSCT